MVHAGRIAALFVMVTASAEAQELAGTFDQLRVLVKSGETQVDRIEKRGPDSLKNGALTGFAIGGLLGGLAIGALADASGSDNVAAPVIGGLLYGGVGAGIGAGIDALIEGQRVIYAGAGSARTRLTIAPVLGGRRKGVLMTLRPDFFSR